MNYEKWIGEVVYKFKREMVIKKPEARSQEQEGQNRRQNKEDRRKKSVGSRQ
jgi:hypothetical protein